MKNKILLLIIAFLAAFPGCKKEESKITTVVFWHAMGGPLGDALEELINQFNDSHPDILIESISMGNYNALSQKIMASILSHRTPTIAQVYSSWTTNLYESRVIEPLENYIKGENGLKEEEITDFYPVFIRDNTIDGKLITLPFNKSIYAYYYNIDLFLAEGITEFPETWTELLKTAKMLQKDDQPVTAFGISVGFFESLLYAFGGRMVDEDNNPAFYSKEGIEALQFIKDLIYKHRVAKLTTGFQHQDQFIAEKIAFIMGTSVSYSFIMKAKPNFKVGIAPLPKEDTTGVMIMGTNIALFADKPAKEKEAAWKFIKWFISPKQQAKWALGTGYVPVRKSANELPEIKDYFKQISGLKKVWDQLYYAELEPPEPAWLFGRKIFSQVVLEPVILGEMDAEERLKIGQKEVEISFQR